MGQKGKSHPWMIGDKNPAKRPEVREKIKKNHKGTLGYHFTAEQKKNIGMALKRKYKECPEYRNRIRKIMTGSNNPNWIDGRSLLTKHRRLKLRFQIFQRDNFTCQYCGRKVPEIILEIDHKYPESKGGEEKIKNYVTSCRECNLGKGDCILDEFK